MATTNNQIDEGQFRISRNNVHLHAKTTAEGLGRSVSDSDILIDNSFGHSTNNSILVNKKPIFMYKAKNARSSLPKHMIKVNLTSLMNSKTIPAYS